LVIYDTEISNAKRREEKRRDFLYNENVTVSINNCKSSGGPEEAMEIGLYE
jgi:hypothetical protein